MKRELYKNALITSPLLAIYGAIPIYTFNKVSFPEFLLICVALTFFTLLFWLVNILLLTKSTTSPDWKRYLLSYIIAFVIQCANVALRYYLPLPQKAEYILLYPFITTIAINTVILILCNSVIINQKKKNAEVEIEQLKVKNLEAEKQVLMQQLQPHFLFNSLSILKSLITNDAITAENYVIKLSDFLRYSVTSHKNEIVTLAEELQFVNDYIELQKVRFDKAFSFTTRITEECLNRRIPVFALQTLVENAFKHNYFTEKKPLYIRISYENGKLKIWNNKVSLKITERSGTGLCNLNKRYQLITGEGIEITETEIDFCVTILLIQE